jgi:uncharacterized membrane protein SirB2
MDYTALKIIHVSCVAVSFALFFGRGLLMLADSPRLNARLLRIAPHVNDTLLLASAIWMAVITRQYPFAENWLTAKLVALVIYIGVGMIALSRGRTKRTRAIAWTAALLVFAYIVSVALSRNPLPFVPR